MTTTTQLEANKRLARRVPEEIATDRRIDAVDEVFAEDAVEHGLFGGVFTGREGFKQQAETIFGAFPDFEATVEEILAEGDLVAMRVTISGTHEGPLMGVEPTGKSFEIGNVVLTRIENGRIAERWLGADTLGVMQQLGIVEMPEMGASSA